MLPHWGHQTGQLKWPELYLRCFLAGGRAPGGPLGAGGGPGPPAPPRPLHGRPALGLRAASQGHGPPGPGGGHLGRGCVRLVITELGAGLLTPGVIVQGIRILLFTFLGGRKMH